MGFVHLHLQTEFSLLHGACKIDKLVSHVKKINQFAVAITDFCCLFGAVKFFIECSKQNIKPILGCELLVLNENYDGSKSLTMSSKKNYFELVVLCENEKGYENLIKIVSLCNFNQKNCVAGISELFLKKHSEGLIALSGGLNGEVAKTFLKIKHGNVENVVTKFCKIFGKENFFLEIQNHGLIVEQKLNECCIKLSKKFKINLVATNDVHYIHKIDSVKQKILNCIKHSKFLNEKNSNNLPNDEFYLKNETEMMSLFLNYEQAISNTVKIAHRCCFKFNFKNFKIPKFNNSSLKKNKMLLWNKSKKGLFLKYGEKPNVYVIQRFIYEFKTIVKLGFVDYFLIVADYVNYAKSVKIAVGPGRGSAVGSLLAFCLNITSIDPIKYGLLFERFLNLYRKKIPDFDVDFCAKRRCEVIDYIKKKYGTNHVANVVTFGTLAAKAAILCVVKLLNLKNEIATKIIKCFPNKIKFNLNYAINKSIKLQKLIKTNKKIKLIFKIATLIEGYLKNISVHAAALIITPKQLSESLPLMNYDGLILTQYAMDDLNELKFLKMDFLGLKTLTLINECVNLIKQKNLNFEIEKISLTNQITFEMLSKGKCLGVFQLESKLACNILVKIKPKTMENLINVVALNRPGPLHFIKKFVENKTKLNKLFYANEKIKSVLAPTYGVIIFQEQVMKLFNIVAGYSFSRVDLIRQAISSKNFKLLENERTIFLFGFKNDNGETESVGALNLGFKKEVAEKIFNSLIEFTSYAFNKSHATAYALIAYETAFLKANYSIFYMVCLLNCAIYNTNKLKNYLIECKKLNIIVKSLDINSSSVFFEILSKQEINYSFLAVKGVGKNLATQIVNERKNKKFNSIENFFDRIKNQNLTVFAFKSLVEQGAFQKISKLNSKQLQQNFILNYEFYKNEIKGQLSLFKKNELSINKHYKIIAEILNKKTYVNKNYETILELTLLHNFKLIKCFVYENCLKQLNFNLNLNDFFVFDCVINETKFIAKSIKILNSVDDENLILIIRIPYNSPLIIENLKKLLKNNYGNCLILFNLNKTNKLFKSSNSIKIKLNLNVLNKIKNLFGNNSIKIIFKN